MEAPHPLTSHLFAESIFRLKTAVDIRIGVLSDRQITNDNFNATAKEAETLISLIERLIKIDVRVDAAA